MPNITLTDGSQRVFAEPVTVQAVAEAISPGLAKAALAAQVDQKLVDTTYLIKNDAAVSIITGKDPQGLEVIRHSTAHLLAQAVKQLFPSAQVTIGPVIENGFYYDFAFERPFTLEDLEQIEGKMQELAKQNLIVERKVMSREDAIQLFSDMGEHYKVEIIREIPAGEQLTAYQQGDFIDLCRGPHVPHSGMLKAFKLTKVAGAYWRGDSNNEMLQRIYGTAWAEKKDLKVYLQRLAEAEKRDHRVLAKKMELFHFQQEAPGMVFWHPRGWSIVRTIRDYVRRVIGAGGYQEVNTPQLVDHHLWEESGHASKFDDDMFTSSSENREYIVKPMNCPCHVQIFKQGLKSYRDLPIRYSEFGSCHRNEPSGTLHGLMRLRGFVQDDGHVFCTEAQVQDEVGAFMQQIHRVYRDFGFTEVIHKLSTRPEKRIGDDETWEKAEQALATALDAQGVEWGLQPGEGAFYGPKIEFSMRDCLGRIWQCGTIQLDYFSAGRLGAYYIAEDGSKQAPIMLHRAMLGSTERFLGILLEQYAGKLPLWLAPIQVIVMNITDRQLAFAEQVVENLQDSGLRVQADLRNEKIGFKIREHTIARVPYFVVIGDREVDEQTLSVRSADDKQAESMSVAELIAKLKAEIKQKSA